jgi:hypothetical protein
LRTKSSDGIEDLVGRFMSDEGFRVTVVVLDKAADGLFEFFGGAVGAVA